MKKVCSYCRQNRKLTREHVWPDCFLKRRKHLSAHFSVKNNKVHGADYIVKDVCEDCNNIILSELDSYFCELYDRYFSNVLGPADEVLFEYDFNRLSRVLLKIAYNSSRAGLTDPTALASTAPFIIGKGSQPSGLIVLLEIVSPTTMLAITEMEITYKEISPLAYRSALTKMMTPSGNKVVSRLVGVNSYYFHLFVPNQRLSDREIAAIKEEALSTLSGAVCLNDKRQVKVTMGSRDGLGTLIPQMISELDQYKGFFDRERPKRRN